MKAFYIIGGMGPQASTELSRLLTTLAEKKYGATNNDDFPEYVIHSVPVPDFINNEEKRDKALKILFKVVCNIDKSRFANFSIACNTAHILAPRLIKSTDVPFVSMIDEVVKRVEQRNSEVVGLLGSPTTIRSRLYTDPLEARGIQVLQPTDDALEKLEYLIRSVIAGRLLPSHRNRLAQIVNQMKARGAESVILGCTELPVLYDNSGDDSTISSLAVLGETLLCKYYAKDGIQ